eukprot:TRINITY_DN5014_c0_g1_i1.p1 TRINITY_DN5014_c0_g1~~TRINITY_DN5014_c0_g1_i1.p1  ORF type:complete len:313 (-),score=85.47 TRINITY_DN5014_c0_g1_i1:37-912(-)
MSKCYIGNLNFKTGEAELAEACKTFGKVVKATVMCRGPRSLGYGFVEFETAEAAAACVAALHGKDMDGRQLVVEVARAPAPRQPAQAAAVAVGEQVATPAGPAAAAAAPRQPRVNRGRMQYGYPAPPPRGLLEMLAMQGYMPIQQWPQMPQGTVPMQQMRATPAATRQEARKQRTTRKKAQWPVTEATMYIGNLPFVVDDANLKEIFKDLHVKDSHVMCSASGRSLGYGFVEFESKEARDTALNTLDKVEVEGRELIIKPANLPAAEATTATTPTAPVSVAAAPAPVQHQQ